MKSAVYRHFSSSGELLYIGFSAKPFDRTYGHSKNASWFGEISKITIEWFETAALALAAEKLAIKVECPRENLKDMPNDLFKKRKPRRICLTSHTDPHYQLDAIERTFEMEGHNYRFLKAGIDRDRYEEIRKTGRELLNSEIDGLKRSLSTTYKKLETLGIYRRNPG